MFGKKPTHHCKAIYPWIKSNKRGKRVFHNWRGDKEITSHLCSQSLECEASRFICLVGTRLGPPPSPPFNHVLHWLQCSGPDLKPPQRATVELLTARGEHTQSSESRRRFWAVAQVFPGQNQCHIKCFRLQCLLVQTWPVNTYQFILVVLHTDSQLYTTWGEDSKDGGGKRIGMATRLSGDLVENANKYVSVRTRWLKRAHQGHSYGPLFFKYYLHAALWVVWLLSPVCKNTSGCSQTWARC